MSDFKKKALTIFAYEGEGAFRTWLKATSVEHTVLNKVQLAKTQEFSEWVKEVALHDNLLIFRILAEEGMVGIKLTAVNCPKITAFLWAEYPALALASGLFPPISLCGQFKPQLLVLQTVPVLVITYKGNSYNVSLPSSDIIQALVALPIWGKFFKEKACAAIGRATQLLDQCPWLIHELDGQDLKKAARQWQHLHLYLEDYLGRKKLKSPDAFILSLLKFKLSIEVLNVLCKSGMLQKCSPSEAKLWFEDNGGLSAELIAFILKYNNLEDLPLGTRTRVEGDLLARISRYMDMCKQPEQYHAAPGSTIHASAKKRSEECFATIALLTAKEYTWVSSSFLHTMLGILAETHTVAEVKHQWLYCIKAELLKAKKQPHLINKVLEMLGPKFISIFDDLLADGTLDDSYLNKLSSRVYIGIGSNPDTLARIYRRALYSPNELLQLSVWQNNRVLCQYILIQAPPGFKTLETLVLNGVNLLINPQMLENLSPLEKEKITNLTNICSGKPRT